MTRFRLFSTLFVLTAGTGMALLYLRPDTPSAPDRIKAESILPQAEPASPADVPASSQAVNAHVEPASLVQPPQPVEPSAVPTVALPSGPLLRAATEAAPLDTSNLDPAGPVRHEPGSQAVGPDPLETAVPEQTASPQPIARPAARRSRPRSTQASSRKVQQLFLNPLGTR